MILIDILVVVLLVYLAPRFIDAFGVWLQPSPESEMENTVTAEVVALLEAEAPPEAGVAQPYQVVQVTVLDGEWAGESLIVFYILPNILAGANPVAVSTFGAFLILAVTLYVVYGWTLKTHAAVLRVLTSLAITGLLAAYLSTLHT